jgi:hypothetical protein
MRRVQRIFGALPGEWHLTRSIDGYGTLEGEATFQPCAPGVLLYAERGRLALTGRCALEARQEHYYFLEPDGIRVVFTTGETLHRLRFPDAAGAWPALGEDVHRCGRDSYAGAYRFESEQRLSVTMRVEGPSKRYAIHSALDRRGRGSPGPP